MKLLHLLLLIALCALLACTSAAPQAELVLRNGAIYTVDAQRSWAEALAIANGRIAYVGNNAGVEKFIGAKTRVLDLHGKMVLPGFHDSHVHPVSGGIELGLCNLNGSQTQQEVFDKIRAYAAAHPEKKWITGGGWDLPIFPGGNPRKEQLDAIVADRPVYLTSADGHSGWANTKALQIAGVTKDTPDPSEGRIERDAKTGEPSGVLREMAADLVSKHQPELTQEDYTQGARAGLALANRFGITSLQEASAHEKILDAFAELERGNELRARVIAAQYVDPQQDTTQIATLVARRAKYQSAHLRATAVKIFADGVIEGHTAALLEPYVDRPHDRGIPNWTPEQLTRVMTALDQAGFQIHTHAIGDFAIRMTLDALAAAQQTNGKRDARHHIAHLQLIDPSDIPRFKQLDVVANFQSLWAYADWYITDLTEPVLGPARSRWLYPIASVAKTGAMLAAGSDWSVSSMNPLEAIQVAITRRALTDTSSNAWIAEELIDLPTMLAAYTINGAFVNHQEQNTGSLELGKAADVIVLDRNLFQIPPHEIHRTKVLLTLLEGKEVYREENFK